MSQLLQQAEQDRLFKEMECQRTQFDDSERLLIIGIHQQWKPKAYGSSEYVRYEVDGVWKLYMSTRNVPANAPAPNVSTNPQNWKLVPGQ